MRAREYKARFDAEKAKPGEMIFGRTAQIWCLWRTFLRRRACYATERGHCKDPIQSRQRADVLLGTSGGRRLLRGGAEGLRRVVRHRRGGTWTARQSRRGRVPRALRKSESRNRRLPDSAEEFH